MPDIPLARPFALKSATFAIGADIHTSAVSQVQFDPATQRATWRGIGGNVLTNQSVAEWTATLSFAQDLAAAGLLRYLHENEGKTAKATFTPTGEGTTPVKIEADVILAPGAIGGTAGAEFATATVQLGVVGKPKFVGTGN